MGGDFNVVRRPEEKLGACIHRKVMGEFDAFIEDSALVDLPLNGGSFTWSSRREDPSFCRLDRFLVSPEILQNWPDVIQKLFLNKISDHSPIAIRRISWNNGPKPFRWFESWADETGYDQVVEEAVTQSKGKGIGAVLKTCKSHSKIWLQSRSKRNPDSSSILEKMITDLEDLVQNEKATSVQKKN
ncbi:hypothetical protein like AT1G43760 [Hibiscus trionum]|uniref:Endonuclease/exonuclease/phosphatase domain-containing protein n=1 Tax=Hibiscus trionum TaxID=183268 RepID=A0A9W7IIC8_HIBTR|nr:hypothetical protein like AT1G43760 [Hibiscus trionum]